MALLSLGSRRDRLESVLTNAATVGFATLAPQQRKGKSHTTASQTHTRQAGYLFSHLPPRRRRSPPLKSHGRRWPCNKYFPLLSGSVHLPYLHNPYRRRRLLDTLSLSLLSTTLLLRLASPRLSTLPRLTSHTHLVVDDTLPQTTFLPPRPSRFDGGVLRPTVTSSNHIVLEALSQCLLHDPPLPQSPSQSRPPVSLL